jgi:DNA-binding NarL/FixJ family response regulator
MRVMLADREGAARRALAALLRGLPDVTLVAEATTREELAAALRRTHADVVVLDERLVEEAGRHILAGLGPIGHPVRVIVVGVDDDPAFAGRAQRLGAEAWLRKDYADEDLPRLLEPS